MAIKDRWSRMLSRKSISSSSSVSANSAGTAPEPSGVAAAAPAPADDSLTKPPSRLAKTLTWATTSSSRSSSPSRRKKDKKDALPRHKQHPSERPLTETNLRHQELLGAFNFTFGSARRRRRSSATQRTSFSGVSPGNSRQASLDAGPLSSSPLAAPGAAGRLSMLGHELEVTREVPGAEDSS